MPMYSNGAHRRSIQRDTRGLVSVPIDPARTGGDRKAHSPPMYNFSDKTL